MRWRAKRLYVSAATEHRATNGYFHAFGRFVPRTAREHSLLSPLCESLTKPTPCCHALTGPTYPPPRHSRVAETTQQMRKAIQAIKAKAAAGGTKLRAIPRGAAAAPRGQQSPTNTRTAAVDANGTAAAGAAPTTPAQGERATECRRRCCDRRSRPGTAGGGGAGEAGAAVGSPALAQPPKMDNSGRIQKYRKFGPARVGSGRLSLVWFGSAISPSGCRSSRFFLLGQLRRRFLKRLLDSIYFLGR